MIGDLEEEARGSGHGRPWLVCQALRALARVSIASAMDVVRADVRMACRSAVRAPWFTLGAVVTFAVGFGVNLAAFAAIDRILFRPAPYGEPARLVALENCLPGTSNCANSFPDDLGAYAGTTGLHAIGPLATVSLPSEYDASATPGAPPLRFFTATPNLLDILRVRPVLGRGPVLMEGTAAIAVALLRFDTWRQRFGGAADVLGRHIGSGQRIVDVIGVLPAGFIPPSPGILDPTWDGLVFKSSARPLMPVARLAPGATVAVAQAEVSAVLSALGPGPRARPGAPPRFVRVVPIDQALFQMISSDAALVAGVVVVLLLMACANLAGLMLARGASREREAALRSALGASRLRIISGSIAEAVVVCFVGAGVAWLGLTAASRAMASVLPPVFARYFVDAFDPRLLGFAVLVASAVAALTGAWPGFLATRVDLVTTLGRAPGSSASPRLGGGRTLIAFESALGMIILVVTALATVSFAKLTGEGVGYRSEDLFYIQARAAAARPPQQALADYRALLDATLTIPGVVGVVGGDSLVGSGGAPMRGFSADPAQRGGRYELSAGALTVMGTPLEAGREFTAEEVASLAPVAMLNEAGAALVAPDLPPAALVGRTIALKGEAPRLVVGLLAGLRDRYGRTADPALYVPLGTQPRVYDGLLVRMQPGTTPNVAVLHARMAQVLGPIRVSASSVTRALEPSLVNPRFRAVLFTVIGLVAAILAAAGLYALTAFELARRRTEMGIRMALGATRDQVRRSLIAMTVWPVAVGLAIGAVATFWGATFLQGFFYRIDGREPLVYAGALVALLLLALITVWWTVGRAARVDPVDVLRTI